MAENQIEKDVRALVFGGWAGLRRLPPGAASGFVLFLAARPLGRVGVSNRVEWRRGNALEILCKAD